MKMIKILLFLSVFMLLAGCGASAPKPAPKPKQTPKWVNSVLPDDDSLHMYGLAIANNRDAAIKAALNDVIARLGTTIESSYESIQKVDGAYANLKVTSSIKADVSKIKINNYRVIKSHKLNYREFAVMLEIDKPKFIAGLKTDLQMKKKGISEELLATKSMSAINRYNTKKELLQRAKSLLSVIYILIELDPLFAKRENLNFVSRVNKSFLNEAKSLQFFVSGNTKAGKFVEKLKNYLAQKGFRVAASKRGAIKILVNVKDMISRGYVRIAVLNLSIAVLDGSKRVGGKELILKERYNNSLESVYKNASIHFEQEIQEKGINGVIGIDLKL